MIEVRIRDQWQDKATAVITTIPYDQLDDVLPLLKKWGLWAGDDVNHDQLCCQFVYNEEYNAFYFEVIIGD